MTPTPSETNGHVLLPKWFLGFLSLVLTLLSMTMIPWAASVTRELHSLSHAMTSQQARFDGQVSLQNEVIRNINQRMERIERSLDQLEQRHCDGPSRANTEMDR